MPFGSRPFDLFIILIVALLIFGPKKLPEMGAAIGKSVTAFKKGIKEPTDDTTQEDLTLLLEQQKLDAKRLELEALEREIANKKAALNAQEASQTVEGSIESTNTEMQTS
jgi:sec-independent protein translocase protein TatA